MDEVSWLECRDARPMMKILASEAFITDGKGVAIADAIEADWHGRRGFVWNGQHFPAMSGVALAMEVIRVHNLEKDQARNADLLRDMVGNPYSPIKLIKPVHPGSVMIDAWHGGIHHWPMSKQAFSLAQAAYEDRRPDWSLDPVRLAILADALEEEGCDCEELLQSLRGYSWPTSCDDCLGSGWIWYADINPELSRKRDGRLYVSDRPNGMTWMVADRDSEPSEGTRCRTCVRGFVRRKLTHPRYRGQWALDLVLGKE